MDCLKLRIADFVLCIYTTEPDSTLGVRGSHTLFLAPDAVACDLALYVRSGLPPGCEDWNLTFRSAYSWSLWRDGLGRQMFQSSIDSPPRKYVIVDRDFQSGDVWIDTSKSTVLVNGLYPLEHIDIMLFANWLSGFGDFLVHAAGVDDGGAGYCLVGPAGAGKSTLARLWSAQAPGTVLGEDQVILRFVDGRFSIFGTPWHQDSNMCSPRGVPLAKIFFLEQSSENWVQAHDPDAAAVRLLESAFAPLYHATGMSKILTNLARLAEQVPFYTLRFRPQADALRYLRHA